MTSGLSLFSFESILEVVQRKKPRVYPDMDLTISDPDSAVAIIQKLGLEIVEDHSGPEPKNTARTFHVRLPGGTIINFWEFGQETESQDISQLRVILTALARRLG